MRRLFLNMIDKVKCFFKAFALIDLNKVWNLLFIILLTWFFSICILDANYTFNPLFIILLVTILFTILVISYKKLSKKYLNLSDKKTWIFYGIVVGLMIVLQSVIGYLVRTNPSWDLGIVIKSAQEMVKYGHSTEMAGYYVQAPNNVLITLIIALSIKIFSIFNLTNINIITLIVNIIFIQISIFLLFKIAKKVYGNFSACFVLVLIALFLPIYPYSTIMYTDTMSMFLPVLFLYLTMKLSEAKNLKKVICLSSIIGFFTFISLNLKVTALILVIAFFINEIINGRFKKMLLVGIVLICSFGIFEFSFVTFLKKTNIIGIDYELTQEVPFTHFIMMGMYGTGAFDVNEWQFTLMLPDKDTRKKENIRVIKERLSNYKIQGYIKFLNNKVKGQTWGSGTYDFETILNSYNIDNNIAHEFLLHDGKYYDYVYYYCQTFHFTMIFSIIVSIFSSIKSGEKKKELDISKLSILGLLIFLLIWETRSRYMLNFIPIYILVMFSGILYFSKNGIKIIKKLFLKN